MLKISLISKKNQEIIHGKSLHILENTGIAFNYEPALQLLKKHGARIDGRTAYIPSDLVRECLGTCPSSFHLEARDSSKSVVFGQKDDFLVLPNLGPVFIQDGEGPAKGVFLVLSTVIGQKNQRIHQGETGAREPRIELQRLLKQYDTPAQG